MNQQIQQLQQELAATLKKAESNRKLLKISQVICYGATVIYFIILIALYGLGFSGDGSPFIHNYELNPAPTFWEANKILMFILPVILLVTIGSAGLGFFYKKFTSSEQNSVRRIVKTMFPEAKCYLETSELSLSLINSSHFFGGLATGGNRQGATLSLGAIVFDMNGQKLDVRDIVVNGSNTGNKLMQTQIGGMVVLLKAIFGGLFAKRVENTMSSFRGLFAHARIAKNLNGSVVILPDHLECHLDYLAKTVQSLKNINGNRLVQLEDVEFERYFVVYSTDEVLARYVLTPAMMLRMTELRKKYNRDIMLSFNGDKFFFAVAMPEGFLTLGNDSAHPNNSIKDVYDNIVTVREILKELKLDKAPENKIRL